MTGSITRISSVAINVVPAQAGYPQPARSAVSMRARRGISVIPGECSELFPADRITRPALVIEARSIELANSHRKLHMLDLIPILRMLSHNRHYSSNGN